MNSFELREAISARVNRAAHAKIWNKVMDLAEKYGSVFSSPDENLNIPMAELVYKFEVMVGTSKLKLLKYTRNMVFHGVVVLDGEKVVFAARIVIDTDRLAAPYDKERVISVDKKSGGAVYIESFIPGGWELYMNDGAIEEAIAAENKRRRVEEELKNLQEEREKAEKEKLRPLNAHELELAEKFGININSGTKTSDDIPANAAPLAIDY